MRFRIFANGEIERIRISEDFEFLKNSSSRRIQISEEFEFLKNSNFQNIQISEEFEFAEYRIVQPQSSNNQIEISRINFNVLLSSYVELCLLHFWLLLPLHYTCNTDEVYLLLYHFRVHYSMKCSTSQALC